MGRVDTRKLRDKATKLVEKRKYDKAVTLYHELEAAEPGNADWSRRAADCYRRLDKKEQALMALSRAADKYSGAGFLVKAVAMCKMILAIDPRHTATLERMAALQSERGMPSAPAPAAVALSQAADAGAAAPASPSLPAALEVPEAEDLVLVPSSVASIDEHHEIDQSSHSPPSLSIQGELTVDDTPRGGAGQRARTLLPGAALDSISLSEVFPDSRPVSAAEDGSASIYEIVLDGIDESLANDIASFDITDSLESFEPGAPTGPASPSPATVASPLAAADAPGLSIGDAHESMGDALAAAAAMAGRGAANPDVGAGANADVGERDDDEESFAIELSDDDLSSGGDASDTARAVLPRTPLFSDLSPAGLQRVIGGVELVLLDAGEAVFRQGDAADAFYVVSEGSVAAIDEGPPRVQLGTISEGQFFGEIGVVTDQPRGATVEAIEPSELLKIKRDLISDLVDAEPGVLKVMLRFLRDRLIDNLVRTSPLFEPFQGAERTMLAARFKFLEIEPGSTLIAQGQRAGGLYVLLTGRAEVSRADGDSQRLATLGPGDIFGEMSLLSQEVAVADVRAVSKCFALELPAAVFREIIMTHPQVLMFVGDLAEQRKRQNASIASGEEDYSEGHLELF